MPYAMTSRRRNVLLKLMHSLQAKLLDWIYVPSTCIRKGVQFICMGVNVSISHLLSAIIHFPLHDCVRIHSNFFHVVAGTMDCWKGTGGQAPIIPPSIIATFLVTSKSIVRIQHSRRNHGLLEGTAWGPGTYYTPLNYSHVRICMLIKHVHGRVSYRIFSWGGITTAYENVGPPGNKVGSDCLRCNLEVLCVKPFI